MKDGLKAGEEADKDDGRKTSSVGDRVGVCLGWEGVPEGICVMAAKQILCSN